jgi:hypothetical protein
MSARFGTLSAGSQQTDFRHACKLGLECIVSKRKGSPYDQSDCNKLQIQRHGTATWVMAFGCFQVQYRRRLGGP